MNTVNLNDPDVRALYQHLMDSWNQRDAVQFSELFTDDGSSVGFDGSQLNRRDEIRREMQRVFRDHQTAAYVCNIREVRFLSPEVALLRAVAGMTSPGMAEINPAVNAIHSLVPIPVRFFLPML